MIVVEHSLHSKTTGILNNARHFSDALNAQLRTASIGRRNQNLNSNICSNRGTFATENQCAVQRNIAGESPLRAFRAVIPMEYYWQT